MINNIIIKIKLYGIYKKYNIEYIFLSVPFDCNIKSLKQILLKELFSINESIFIDEVLNCSIFANNDNILNDDYIILNKEEIFLFPPVNGG
ncbi:MAG TPA: hypothetical protein V8P47_01065 [Candidatus Azosocius sp. HAIN]